MPSSPDFSRLPRSEPIRRDLHLKITVDSQGNPVVEPVAEESVALSPEGSIDRVKISTDRTYHCGCTVEIPMGGRCGEPGCQRLSCQRCHGRCAVCYVPLCLEHSRYLTTAQAQKVRLCSSCCNALKRKQLFRALAKAVLSPFVRFDRKNP